MDDDPESCFAVLMPCYRHGRAEQPGRSEGWFLADGGLSDGKNFVEQWLSSLEN